MKKALLWIAAGVVLSTNAWTVYQGCRNQRGSPGGRVELTERELHCVAVPGESTVTLVEFRWDVLRAPGDEPQASPHWLEARKLTELGFDCRVPVTDPIAADHYRSLAPRPVFLVLEYEGAAWRQADSHRKTTTRLFVVDAGLDPHRLRDQYPDAERYLLLRGVVRPWLQDRESRDGPLLDPPRIRGWIQSLLPAQILVPLPHSRELAPFRDRGSSERAEPQRQPRFAVTVASGRHYEPWVTAVRLAGTWPVLK